MSHFSPSHEPFVILYLVPHFSEVWKGRIVWQIEFNCTLSLSHEKLSALYAHLVLFLYGFLHFSLRTIFILNSRYTLYSLLVQNNRPFAASHSRGTKPQSYRRARDTLRKLPCWMMYAFCFFFPSAFDPLLSSMTVLCHENDWLLRDYFIELTRSLFTRHKAVGCYEAEVKSNNYTRKYQIKA